LTQLIDRGANELIIPLSIGNINPQNSFTSNLFSIYFSNQATLFLASAKKYLLTSVSIGG
jgi:hypothetical protein